MNKSLIKFLWSRICQTSLFFLLAIDLNTNAWVGAQPLDTPLDTPLTIPAQTPLAVMLKTPVNFVPDLKGGSLPLTGYLMLPLHDKDGQLLAPKGTLVTLWLEPETDSAILRADGLILDSQLIPLNTVPLAIPAQRGEFTFDSEYIPNPSRFNQVSTNLLGVVLESDGIDPPVRAGLGLGLGVISGISSPKAKRSPKVINIEGESVYILMLKSESPIPPDVDLQRDSEQSETEEEG